MIRQIIFDVGGVLLDFDPAAMVRAVTDVEADAALLRREIFSHADWSRLDRGEGEERVLSSMKTRLPERLHPQADRIMAGWHRSLRSKEDVGALVRELYDRGYPLYILSNAPFRFYEFRDLIPGFGLMRGVMLSCEEGLLKPDPALFRRLFERFALQPSECFFIDDSPLNIEAAQWCGMGAFQFRQDVAELRAALGAAGVPAGPDPISHQRGEKL